MNQKTKRLLALIRSEICGQVLIPDDYIALSEKEWDDILCLAKSHAVAHLAANVALKYSLTDDQAVLAALKRYKYYAISHNIRLNACLTKCRELFLNAGISFLLLKGPVIREYYPQPWMRTCADIDILIAEKDYEKAERLVSATDGFRYRNTTPHDVSFLMTEGIVLELHHSLIAFSRRIGADDRLLNGIWDYADLDVGTEYRLKDEMFYYYHLAHMAKHIETGGCGIRPFIDLWILNHRLPDNPVRNALLEKGGLRQFSRTVNDLSEYWFGDGEADENTLLLERFILSGGSFGTKENAVSVKSARLHGTAGYMLQKIWMPYPYLCCQYPELKGKRLLQPAYEVRRWMRIVFKGNIGFVKQELELTQKASGRIPDAKKLRKHLAF